MIFSDSEKIKIKNDVIEKLNKSFDINVSIDEDEFIHKAILHILDVYNTGNFYGDIVVKIQGVKFKGIKHENVSISVSDKYNFLSEKVNEI